MSDPNAPLSVTGLSYGHTTLKQFFYKLSVSWNPVHALDGRKPIVPVSLFIVDDKNVSCTINEYQRSTSEIRWFQTSYYFHHFIASESFMFVHSSVLTYVYPKMMVCLDNRFYPRPPPPFATNPLLLLYRISIYSPAPLDIHGLRNVLLYVIFSIKTQW